MLVISNRHVISKNRKVLNVARVKICTALATTIFLVTGCGQPHFNRSQAEHMERNTSKIKIGMTKQELRNEFGKPHDYYPRGYFFYDEEGLAKASSWRYLYRDDDFSHSIDFDPHTGKVIKAEKESSPYI